MNTDTFRHALITIVVICFALPDIAYGQEPFTNRGDVWKVDYRVLVTGDFSVEPEIGSEGPTIYYHIKREYLGRATLRYDPKAGGSVTSPVFKNPNSSVRIKINDFIHSIYPVICEEYESTEEFWTADVDTTFGDDKPIPALLLIDTKAKAYKTSFPILYIDDPESMSDKLVYKKTQYKNPGRKVKESPPDERFPFVMHDYPNVKGYIEGKSIRRAAPLSELTQHPEGYLTWLSPVLHPDKPLYEGVPDSKDKVYILIHFAIKKVTK
ncbi:MAG: hypothetical protein IT173_12780 [Acidobacteria bacterium]|nr:hypothetical protein [Acidobacteriota bacterium]